MADTLTTYLKLTKPQNAGSDDTWGTKLNANLDTIDAELHTVRELSGSGAEPAGQITTGRYHAIGLCEFGAAVVAVAGATLYCIPVTQLVRASGLALEITTISGFAGTAILGLYDSDSNGRPAALAEQCAATIDCNGASGIFSTNFAANRLIRPDQWVVVSTPASVGSLAFRKGVLNTYRAGMRLGMAASLSTTATGAGLSKSFSPAALPAGFDQSGLAVATGVPLIAAVSV